MAPEHERSILYNRSTADAVPPTNALSTSMKRTAATEAPQKRARKAAAQSRPPERPPVACIISGLHADCKIAVARCLMQELETQRLTHNHVGDTMLQSDVSAVYLLSAKVAVNKKTNKFVGRVAADHNSILKTHRHLFKKV